MESTEFLKKLGYRIRSLRKALELSQEKLAELAGIHPTYVSEIELGKANASICVYDTIAAALGLTLSELVSTGEFVDDDDLAKVIAQVKTLDKKKRLAFISAAQGLLSGIKDL